MIHVQEQYILNESANVFAPWKQKYFLALCCVVSFVECCFHAHFSPFYVSNKLLT